jgi:hypothetical protein
MAGHKHWYVKMWRDAAPKGAVPAIYEYTRKRDAATFFADAVRMAGADMGIWFYSIDSDGIRQECATRLGME